MQSNIAPIGSAVNDSFDVPTSSVETQLINIKRMFDEMEVVCDVNKVFIPKNHFGYDRLIINPWKLSISMMVDFLKLHFKVSDNISNLDTVTLRHDRTNIGKSYAVFVHNRTRASENWGVYPNAKQRVSCVSLQEQMLYTVLYYRESNIFHLDTDSQTVCHGSCLPSGIVPALFWNKEKDCLDISWQHPIIEEIDLKTRLVIF